jgi:hypothetical protein
MKDTSTSRKITLKKGIVEKKGPFIVFYIERE